MSASRTTTTTISATAGPSRSRPVPPPPPPPSDSAAQEEEDLEDKDEDDIIRKAHARVERVRARKAAEAAKKKAEEEAARAAAEKKRKAQEAREQARQARRQEEEVAERRRLLAAAVTARSQRGTSPSEVSVSSRRPVVEIQRTKSKGKGKARAEPVGGDPDDGDDGDDDDDDNNKEPCERCRVKKISCQMQAGKRSSVICKPCHDAKVRCLYSGRPSTVKREGGSNPTGERLAVLESQVAQLLADNRQLRDGQVKANTYHRHFNRKLDWLITDAARRRRTPPEMPEAGPSGISRKRRRVVDSDEEEAREVEERIEKEVEKDGEGEEEEMEEEGMAPTEKGKERAE
ncbi:hypothetical protein F5051DRAFT_447509 [Lentinula edodes]|nr:hypothetical protein F5051DRAFT_447509 [Lentinula edodes]